MDRRLLFTLTVEEYKQITRELYADALIKKPIHHSEIDDDLMSRYQVSEKFNISLVPLNEWCKKGILKKYKIKTRVYFKKSEVMAALKPVNSDGEEDIAEVRDDKEDDTAKNKQDKVDDFIDPLEYFNNNILNIDL